MEQLQIEAFNALCYLYNDENMLYSALKEFNYNALELWEMCQINGAPIVSANTSADYWAAQNYKQIYF